MKYWFHPEAAAEHEDQAVYYDARQAGLGRRYNLTFRSVMSVICEAPARCKLLRGSDIRGFGLDGFPFTVIFRERHGEIQVLAVAHHRRRPDYWVRRIAK